MKYRYLGIGAAVLVCVAFSVSITLGIVYWQRAMFFPVTVTGPSNEPSVGTLTNIQRQLDDQSSALQSVQTRVAQNVSDSSNFKPLLAQTNAGRVMRELVGERTLSKMTQDAGSSIRIHPGTGQLNLMSFDLPKKIWDAYAQRGVDILSNPDDAQASSTWTLSLQKRTTFSDSEAMPTQGKSWSMSASQPGPWSEYLDASLKLNCNTSEFAKDPGLVTFALYIMDKYPLQHDIIDICKRIKVEKPIQSLYASEPPLPVYRFDLTSVEQADGTSSYHRPAVLMSVGYPFRQEWWQGFVVEWRDTTFEDTGLNYVTDAQFDSDVNDDIQASVKSFLDTAKESICTNDYMGC